MIQLLERHYAAAWNEAANQQLDIVKQHVAAVTAILNAVNAYAEWAPLPDLAKYGIIHGYDVFFSVWQSRIQIDVLVSYPLSYMHNRCGCLLTSPEFRLHACEFFKLVSPRYAFQFFNCKFEVVGN